MTFPDFFNQIPTITVRDPLAAFLGASEHGLFEYRYEDAVKLTGHSCPTVASSYWMTALALKSMYQDELPTRGGIRVEFMASRESGATGVMAAVVQMLTGAAGSDGFKGLSGIFFRNDLMTFGASGVRQIRFIQRDTLRNVDVSVDLSRVPVQRDLKLLLQKCLNGNANESECKLFGEMWQERVRRLLLEHGQDPDVFCVVQGR